MLCHDLIPLDRYVRGCHGQKLYRKSARKHIQPYRGFHWMILLPKLWGLRHEGLQSLADIFSLPGLLRLLCCTPFFLSTTILGALLDSIPRRPNKTSFFKCTRTVAMSNACFPVTTACILQMVCGPDGADRLVTGAGDCGAISSIGS